MPGRNRHARIGPEFYFHVVLRRDFSGGSLEELEETLRVIARSVFRALYPQAVLEFEVVLEHGSLRGWIRTHKGTLVSIVLSISAGVARYGEIRAGAQTLYDDFTRALDGIRQRVVEVVDEQWPDADVARTERRRGALARLDRLMDAFQHNQITYEEYMERARRILDQIAASDDGGELIAAYRRYARARYADFVWRGLVDDSTAPDEPERSERHGYKQDGLDEFAERRRRRRGN